MHVLTSKAQDVHENVSLNAQNVHVGLHQNKHEINIPLLPPSFFVSQKNSHKTVIF